MDMVDYILLIPDWNKILPTIGKAKSFVHNSFSYNVQMLLRISPQRPPPLYVFPQWPFPALFSTTFPPASHSHQALSNLVAIPPRILK